MSIAVLAQVGGIFALLTLLHFIADWVFQSHAEAMVKHRNGWVRLKHCLVYTAICCLVLKGVFGARWWTVMESSKILFFSHFFEDSYLPVFVWAKYIRKPDEMKDVASGATFKKFAETALGKILLITIDQLVHLVFLLPIAVMLVVPKVELYAALVGKGAALLLFAFAYFGSKEKRLP